MRKPTFAGRRLAAIGAASTFVMLGCSESSPQSEAKRASITDGGDTTDGGAPPVPQSKDGGGKARPVDAGPCPPHVLKYMPDTLDTANLELEKITEIEGGLTLYAPKAATLARFVCLRKVSGSVWLGNRQGSPSFGLPNIEGSDITSLAGLERLESIGGDLTIFWNPELSTLEALGALRTVGGSLKLDFVPKLRDLRGLEGISALGGLDVSLVGIESLNGLRHLETVTHGVTLQGQGTTSTLRSLAELANLKSIGGLRIESSNLESLDLSALKTAGGNVAIVLNQKLATLGLGALEAIQGEVRIAGNPALTSLGFTALRSVADILVADNESLPACAPAELARQTGATCTDRLACDAACVCKGNNGTGTCP